MKEAAPPAASLQSPRRRLARWRRAMLVLVAVNAGLLAASFGLSAVPAAGGLPWALTAGLTSTALTLTALGWLWQRWRRAEQDLIAAATAQAQLAHQQLADVLDALPAGFELFDKDDRLVRSNAVLREMYPNIVQLLDQQPTFEAMVRHNHAAGGLPGLGESFEDWLAERLHTLRTPGSPILHQAAGGRWVRAHHRRLPDGGLIGVRVDVTEEVRQKEAAELAANRLSDAIEAISDGFAYYDADDRLVLCNERYRAVYGDLATMVVPGVTFEALVRRGLALGLFPQAAGHEQEWVAERVQQHRNPGPPFLQELPGNRWLNIDERRTRDGGVAGVRTDVTAMVRREQELQRLNDRLDAANTRLAQLSETDALTAIANRRQFDRRLAEEAARASRHGLPLALLMIDVDHFKRFNDAHGHPAGDECLRRVAAALAGCARRPSDLVARVGGEEFAILLPHAGADEALAMAQHSLQAVDAEAIAHGDSPLAAHVTLSIGLATLPLAGVAPGDESAALLEAADAALYRAKEGGRHRVVSA